MCAEVFSITMPLVMFLDACEHCVGGLSADASLSSTYFVDLRGGLFSAGTHLPCLEPAQRKRLVVGGWSWP